MVLATASFASFTQKNAFDKSATSSSPQSLSFPQSQPLISTSSFTSPQSQSIVATNDLYTRACEYAEEPANSFSIPHYSLDLRAWVYNHKLVLLEQKKAYLRYLKKCFADKRSGTESHLGSTMAVVNADGPTPTVKEATWYHPYGTMVPLAEQNIPVRTKFTGKELDGGETPYCEFEFDLAITNFDAGRHYYGQLFVTYQDIVTSVQYDKVYNFDYDRSQQKFTLKANEQFATRTTISRIRIATSGASGGIYNDIARSYPVDVGNGKRLAFSVDGAVLQNNPGVPQYQVTTYVITDIKRGSDLFYFGARYYDAELGVWTSKDPSNQFWSPYSYTGNGISPIIGVDPDGREVRVYYTTNAFFISGLRHVWIESSLYPYLSRGESGSLGNDELGNGVKKGNYPYHVIDISKTGKSEYEFMWSVYHSWVWNKGVYFPYLNDCHSQLKKAMSGAGINYSDQVKDLSRVNISELSNTLIINILNLFSGATFGNVFTDGDITVNQVQFFDVPVINTFPVENFYTVNPEGNLVHK
jgi:RHS repeat-associated protein